MHTPNPVNSASHGPDIPAGAETSLLIGLPKIPVHIDGLRESIRVSGYMQKRRNGMSHEEASRPPSPSRIFVPDRRRVII